MNSTQTANLLAISLFLLTTFPIGAQDLFEDSGQDLGADLSVAVALGDVDGDLDQDAMVVTLKGPTRLWLNQGGLQAGGPGRFSDSGQSLQGGLGVDVALGDLDSDGDLDAFGVFDSGSNSNIVWLNQGGIQEGTLGIFVHSGQDFGNDLNSGLALGDVDGDQDLDAFIARNVGRADQVWVNQGRVQEGTEGVFSDSGQVLGSDSGTDVALGDLDGDGDLDAFVTNGAANRIWVNQGRMQAGTEGEYLDSGQILGDELSLSVALGDLDGDLDLDAFVGNSAADRVWINQGGAQGGTAGQFADSGQLLGSTQSRDVALADVDGDLDLDAYVARNGANEVWINQGGAQGGAPGVFQNAALSLGNRQSEGVALADVDDDGDIDAFVANFGTGDKIWLNNFTNPLSEVNPFGWQIQFADLSGTAGRGVSLALAADGLPHVAYNRFARLRSGNNNEVRYARFDGVRWLVDVVERFPRATSNSRVALALDRSDRPHIAYAATNTTGEDNLHYAFWDGSSWQRQVVDGSGEVNGYVSLALDSSDTPHIGFRRDDTDSLMLAVQQGAGWQQESIATSISSFFAESHDLKVATSGDVHVVYYDGSAGTFLHALRSGQSWQIEVVDSDPVHTTFDGFVALALDAGGMPHMSYVGDFAEEVRYARRSSTGWEIERVADVGGLFLNGDTSLALDASGRPRVAYSAESIEDLNTLFFAHKDSGTWTNETVDDDGSVGLFNGLALDADDHAHIAYYDAPYGDLRYVSWDRRWQIQPVDTSGLSRAPSVAVANQLPAIGYHDLTSGQVNGALWRDGAWGIEPVGFSSAEAETSLARTANGPELLSHYDADLGRLMYGQRMSMGWSSTEIDAMGDVGRYHRLLARGNALIAYWDATGGRHKLASFDLAGVNVPQISTNTAGPALPGSASGRMGATLLAGGDVGISYYDAVNGDLRFAVWQAATGDWSDEAVASAGDVGAFNDVATDGSEGFPVIAFHDAGNRQIRYGHRDASGVWQLETVVANVDAVTALSLDLGLDSRLRGRITYIDSSDNALRAAARLNGAWYPETIALTGTNADMDLAVDQRSHLAFSDDGTGLSHIFRTATIDVASGPIPPQPPLTESYNPLDACLAVLEFFLTGTVENRKIARRSSQKGPFAPLNPLSDQQIFEALPAHFDATSGGRHYIGLYRQHGSEMGRLGLADRQLLADSYGMLQNFLPGLGAMVSGNGDEVLIDQEMVDDALDIWQRLAADGSPELAQTINEELAKYNNLQDFVDLSFDEWFASLVNSDVLFADGFESSQPAN